LAWGQKSADEEAGSAKVGPYIKAGAIAHGTLVTKEDFDGMQSPLFLVCVDNDPLFPEEILEAGTKYLEANKIEHETKIYPGVPHGEIFQIKTSPLI
jgi:dienelactone hydrolase